MEKIERQKSEITIDSLRKLATQLLDEIGNSKSNGISISDDFLNDIEYVSNTIYKDNITKNIDLFKLALYVLARKIRQNFIEETSKHEEFFVFAMSINFKKSFLDYEEFKNTSPERSGYLESLYWAKRNVIKKDGKVLKHIYKRIPYKANREMSYTRRDFQKENAPKWQIDLCLKYDSQLAYIRRILKTLANIKRELKWSNDFSHKIINAVKTNSELERVRVTELKDE